MNYVRVALDVPLNTLFDYRADAIAGIAIGSLVLVPFGKKIAVGVVLEFASTSQLAPSRVRAVIELLANVPPLPADVLSILKFCSNYYRHPIGEVVLNALPTRLRRRNGLSTGKLRFCLTEAGRAVRLADLPMRASLRRALLTRLQAAIDGLDANLLRAQIPGALGGLRTMAALGWVERVQQERPAVENQTLRILPGPELIEAQQTAVEKIAQSFATFGVWLLHGVTGSGKTEVYLELIAAALAANKQTLLLVPEINLTPQLEARIQARFPDIPVVRLNSALNDSERLHSWLDSQSGRAGIVLGTRLAVFVPLPRLGLIVVDEEHDSSFKQGEGLRYSARDIALLRAKQRAVPIVLGSATPSLESYHQALRGRYGMLTLTQRVNATIPLIETIDVRGETLIDGISQAVLRAIQEVIKKGEQSLIYINRRGYAPVLICAGCSWTSGCPRCTAKLVVHLKSRQMRCHHCGHQERIPAHCPQCGNAELAPLGQGTQRIESALTRFFPSTRILRIDRDSTRAKHAWKEMRRQINAREIDILVGTQMLAKGHDFPNLTLVCVINADASLYSTDFRASERLFSNLMQVAGRAGRADLPGRVLIQTEFPLHPLYAALRRQDYVTFANDILAERRQAGLPPFSHQAILRTEAPRQDSAMDFLKRAANCPSIDTTNVTIYDPVPASMSRVAGKERAQLTVQSGSRTSLHAFLQKWEVHLERLADRKIRRILDIDPLEP